VFYALGLDATALPTDKTYANQKKAADILNKVWKEEPNHPGVVHYLIHSDDSAQFAQAGLDAAICYAKIVPDVPHALHMPSHIFTRLSMWQESGSWDRTRNSYGPRARPSSPTPPSGAALSLGDCASYALAKRHNLPFLL
jgi:hypothetical protein